MYACILVLVSQSSSSFDSYGLFEGLGTRLHSYGVRGVRGSAYKVGAAKQTTHRLKYPSLCRIIEKVYGMSKTMWENVTVEMKDIFDAYMYMCI